MFVQVENFEQFERMVADAFRADGYEVAWPAQNQPSYDMIAVSRDGSERIAVQVKALRRSVNVSQVRKFTEYIDTFPGREFTGFAFVSASGFSNSAIARAQEREDQSLRLATLSKSGRLQTLYPSDMANSPTASVSPALEKTQGKTYVGVFTCKGGVGKTTVAAHLAGALAMSGYEVALLDLDPQRNLNNLLPDGVYLPKSRCSVSVYDYDEWSAELDPHSKVVVCDCSPAIESNPQDLIAKFNYCLVPTTLNPLGLNKNGHVITSTLAEIRKHNAHANLFVLINNLQKDDNSSKLRRLKAAYKDQLSQVANRDSKFHFIDPEEECAIRNSNLLYYWGMHLYTGQSDPNRSNLAFERSAGRCYPLDDFLQLVDYLQERTSIQEFKGEDDQS